MDVEKFNELKRQISIKKGDKVVMTNNCAEFEIYGNRIWIVTQDSMAMCGSICCFLDGFCGAFDCEFLLKID